MWARLTVFVALLAGCGFERAFERATEHQEEFASESGTTGPHGSTAATDPDGGGGRTDPVQTATGDAPASTSTTTADPSSTGETADPSPTISKFAVTPAHLGEAGAAELQLATSPDVVKVRLSLDGEKLADLTPADFPFSWEALSARDNGLAREFSVVVEDAAGQTATDTAEISVQLPASGVQRCLFEDPDRGAVTSVVAAVKYTKVAIYAVGTRDAGSGLRLTMWALDPKTCALLPGWPRSLADWSADATAKDAVSLGAAADVDEDGNLVVAGNLMIGDKPRGYVALLNAGGSRLWEKTGSPGDEVMGVAAAIGPFVGRVFVVGARRTSDVPVLTDGAIWVYQASGETVLVPPPLIMAAPFTPDDLPDEANVQSEWVRAVVVHPGTGHALAVGEREFRDTIDSTHNRAFSVRVHPLGAKVGTPWTSPADALFSHDAARAVAVCSEGFLGGGWTRDEPLDAPSYPALFWLGKDGVGMNHRVELQLSSTQIHGMACDREGKAVSAAIRLDGPSDARVFAVWDAVGPRTEYEKGVAGNDGAGAIACDVHGFCVWGGYRILGGKPYAVLRVHHP